MHLSSELEASWKLILCGFFKAVSRDGGQKGAAVEHPFEGGIGGKDFGWAGFAL